MLCTVLFSMGTLFAMEEVVERDVKKVDPQDLERAKQLFASSKPRKPKRPECPVKPGFPTRPSFMHFARLGVSLTATETKCREEWKKIIRLVHTDKGGSDASSKEINSAWTAIKKYFDTIKDYENHAKNMLYYTERMRQYAEEMEWHAQRLKVWNDCVYEWVHGDLDVPDSAPSSESGTSDLQDYFNKLGLPVDSSEEDIKAAYIELVKTMSLDEVVEFTVTLNKIKGSLAQECAICMDTVTKNTPCKICKDKKICEPCWEASLKATDNTCPFCTAKIDD